MEDEHGEELVCSICLESRPAELGVLDSCVHLFCFDCISRWSRQENRCPCCKARFWKIFSCSVSAHAAGEPLQRALAAVRLGGGAPCSGQATALLQVLRTQRVEAKDQVAVDTYDPEEEEEQWQQWLSQLECEECRGTQDEELLMLCDCCNRGFHTYCVNLTRIPRGDWFCSSCRPTQPAPRRSASRREAVLEILDSDDEAEEAAAGSSSSSSGGSDGSEEDVLAVAAARMETAGLELPASPWRGAPGAAQQQRRRRHQQRQRRREPSLRGATARPQAAVERRPPLARAARATPRLAGRRPGAPAAAGASGLRSQEAGGPDATAGLSEQHRLVARLRSDWAAIRQGRSGLLSRISTAARGASAPAAAASASVDSSCVIQAAWHDLETAQQLADELRRGSGSCGSSGSGRSSEAPEATPSEQARAVLRQVMEQGHRAAMRRQMRQLNRPRASASAAVQTRTGTQAPAAADPPRCNSGLRRPSAAASWLGNRSRNRGRGRSRSPPPRPPHPLSSLTSQQPPLAPHDLPRGGSGAATLPLRPAPCSSAAACQRQPARCRSRSPPPPLSASPLPRHRPSPTAARRPPQPPESGPGCCSGGCTSRASAAPPAPAADSTSRQHALPPLSAQPSTDASLPPPAPAAAASDRGWQKRLKEVSCSAVKDALRPLFQSGLLDRARFKLVCREATHIVQRALQAQPQLATSCDDMRQHAQLVASDSVSQLLDSPT